MTTDIKPTAPAPQTAATSFWQFALVYRRLLVGGLLLGLVLGVALALTREVTYTSNATILFASYKMGLGGLIGSSGGADLPSIPLLEGALLTPQPGTSARTAKLILQSWPVQDKLIQEFGLKQHWKASTLARARKQYNKSVMLREGDAGDMRIGFTDPSPKIAYQLSRAMVRELQERSEQLGLNSADRNRRFLEQQLADAEDKLARVQQQVQAFEQREGIYSLPDQVKILAEQYGNVQENLDTAKMEASLASHRASLLSSHAQRLIQACVDPNGQPAEGGNTLSVLYKRVVTQESDLALLRDKFAATSPEVQDETQKLQEAKRLLTKEIDRQLALVRTGNTAAISTAVIEAVLKESQAQRLEATMAKMRGEVEELPGAKAEYARLTMEAEAQVERVKLFRVEVEKARIVSQNRGPFFTVIEPARLADEPNPRGRLRLIIMCCLLGLLVTVAVPYFKWQQHLRALDGNARMADFDQA